ncbi:hypothetical protein ACVINI_000509 [Rhizobium beringeri]
MTTIVAVLMLMLVAMFVIMVMAVIMPVVMPVVMIVIMIVIVIMPMRMPALGMIGPARRLERLVDLENDGAEALQHGADDMVAEDDDAVFLDLRGKMPVAKMPGELDQMGAVATADFEEFLVGGEDLDQFAVVAHQQVAIGEKHRILEIEHDHFAIFQMQQLAAQMTQIMRQLDLGDRVGGRGSGGKIGGDALHDMSVFLRGRPCKIALPDASTNGLSSGFGFYIP